MHDDDASPTHPQAPTDDDWLKAASSWWSEARQVAGAGFRARLDREIRLQVKPPAHIPTAFDAQFRQHALPKLAFWARYLGKRIARKDWDYTWCHDVLVREALSLGASDTTDFQGLIDYLSDRLVEAIMANELPEAG